MKSDATLVVIGCGMAGLGAASVLREAGTNYVILEQEDGPGGLARSDTTGNYWFDRAGHFVHGPCPRFAEEIAATGIVFEEHRRNSAVILDGVIVPFPLQLNLWAAAPALRQGVRRDLAAGRIGLTDMSGSFETLLKAAWGPSLYRAFFEPYHEKMLAGALSNLPPSWGAQFIPHPDIHAIETGLERPITGYGYNAVFTYPRDGRIGVLPEALSVPHRARLVLGTRVTKLDLAARTLWIEGGRALAYTSIVATLPLPQLLQLSGSPCSETAFAHSNILNVRVGFKGRMLRGEHWYYVPDREVPFFRVGVPSNVNMRTCPPGRASLSIEYGLGQSAEPAHGTEAIAHSALDLLASLGALECEAVEAIDVHLIAPAYVSSRMPADAAIRDTADKLARDGVFVAGRYGAWDYFSMTQSFQSGAEAAERSLEWVTTR